MDVSNEDYEDIQDFESQCRNRAEIYGSGFMKMISDKSQPGLRRPARRIRLHHVFPDGIGIGWIEAQEYQMVMDSLS